MGITSNVAGDRKTADARQQYRAPSAPAAQPPGTQETRPLTFHRFAPRNQRRQSARLAGRFVARVGFDLAALWVVRATYRLVAHDFLFGAGVSRAARAVLPTGYLAGWEYAVALVLGLLVSGNYGRGDSVRDPARLLAGTALGTGLTLWAAAWSLVPEIVVLQWAAITVMVWVALVLDRALVDAAIARFMPAAPTRARTLLVGDSEDCGALGELYGDDWNRDFRVVGVVNGNREAVAEGKALGMVADLARLVDEHRVETIVVCGEHLGSELEGILDTAVMAGCRLLVAPPWLLRSTTEPRILWQRGRSFLELSAESSLALPETLAYAPSGLYARVGKRVVDVVGSLVGIVLGAVPVLLAGLAQWVGSPGKLFILQPRVGRGGRIFECIKLRSMVRDAEKGGRAQWASADDPRITPVGRWIRRLRIDEIPQFMNVLMGDMSLVGPRPERPELHDEIVKRFPEFRVRLAVKPGITGWAQVHDGYADSIDSSQRKLAFDRRYVANLSWWLDVKLLLTTVRVVLTGHGSR